MKAHVEDVEVEFFDGFFDSDDVIIKGCSDAAIVGISATSPQMKHALHLAERIKSINRDVWIVLGGYHPSSLPQETVNNPQVDAVVIGEGEESMLRIVKGDRSKILWTRPIQDLDQLPWPDRDLIKVERTIALTEKNDGERIMSIQGGRGCHVSCVFCAERVISERNVRRRNVTLLVDEIEHVVDKYNIDLLKFCDPEINPLPHREWVKNFCREVIKRSVDVEFGANIHASNVDKEMFKLMKQAGFRDVWIGVESGSPRILKAMKKGVTVELVKKAFKLAKTAGLRTRGYFMVGMPEEDTTDVAMTFKLAEELNPHVLGLTILAPYPGTEIYEMYKDLDIDWSACDEYSNPYTHSVYLTNEDLKYWQKRFIDKFKDKLCFRLEHGLT